MTKLFRFFSAVFAAAVLVTLTSVSPARAEDKSIPAGGSATLAAGFLCKGDLAGYFKDGNEGGTRGNVVLVTDTVTLTAPFGANCSLGDRDVVSFANELLTVGCGSQCASVAIWCAPAGTQAAVVTNAADAAAANGICGFTPVGFAAVVSPPPAAAAPVTAVTQPAAGACPVFRDGALAPQVVIQKANNADGFTIVCGSMPNVMGAPFGADFPLQPSRTPFNVPPGYVANGDMLIHGVAQFVGGNTGERMDIEALFPRGGTIVPIYGADVYPGGSNEALNRCLAKFAEGSKDTCAIIDPEPD